MSKLEPNSTQIPNSILDDIAPQLSESELRVLLYIARRTYGFQKDADIISYSQLADGITSKTGAKLDSGTGLTRQGVRNGLKGLLKKALISVEESGQNLSYTIKTSSQRSRLVNEVDQSTKLTKSSQRSRPEVVNEVDTQKKGKQRKQSNTKVLGKSQYGNKDINHLFEVWQEHLGYEITSRKQANRNACHNLVKKHGTDGVEKLIRGVALASQDRYAPRIADFSDLQAKFNQLIAWGKKQSNNMEIVEI